MKFADALTILNTNFAVARKGWNGSGMYIKLQRPATNSKMTLPYIYMKTADGGRVPWVASQTDILAGDWYFVEDE